MKKVLAVVLSCVMAGGILAGCSTEVPKENIVTLKWYFPGDEQQDKSVVEEALNKRLEKELGVHLSLNPVKSTDYDRKVSLLFANKEAFDLMFVSDWTNEYYSCVMRNMLVPLNELLDKDAPEIRKSLPDFLMKAPVINNEVYAIPNYQVLYKQWSVVLRKDLLEKYKFDTDTIPKEAGFDTLRALEPFFQIIKENEPDFYPMRQAFSVSGMFFENIEGSNVVIRKHDSSRTVVSVFDTPEGEEGIEMLRQWYNKGYFREDLYNVYSDTTVSGFLKYAADWMVAKPGMEQELFSKYGKEYVVIPVCKPYIESSAGMSTATGISTTSKYPEKAIKLIELLNKDKELYNLICFGIEGKHYEKVDGNHIRISPEKRYFPYTSWMFGNQFNALLLEGQPDDTWETTEKINLEAEKSNIYGFHFNPESIVDKLVQVKAIVSENDYMYTDDKKIMDEFKDSLLKAGIEDIIKETQSQIDQWAKEN